MAPGFWDPSVDLGGRLLNPCRCLVVLACGEVVLEPFVHDFLPSAAFGECIEQAIEGLLIRRQKHQRVEVLARSFAFALQTLLGPAHGG